MINGVSFPIINEEVIRYKVHTFHCIHTSLQNISFFLFVMNIILPTLEISKNNFVHYLDAYVPVWGMYTPMQLPEKAIREHQILWS